MLISTLIEPRRDEVSFTAPATVLATTRLEAEAASNVGRYDRDAALARRLRRQRREERRARHSTGGWTARIW